MYTKKNPNGDIKQPTSGTFSQLEKKGVVLHGPFTNVFFGGTVLYSSITTACINQITNINMHLIYIYHYMTSNSCDHKY